MAATTSSRIPSVRKTIRRMAFSRTVGNWALRSILTHDRQVANPNNMMKRTEPYSREPACHEPAGRNQPDPPVRLLPRRHVSVQLAAALRAVRDRGRHRGGLAGPLAAALARDEGTPGAVPDLDDISAPHAGAGIVGHSDDRLTADLAARRPQLLSCAGFLVHT